MHLKQFGLGSEPFAASFHPDFFYRGFQHGAVLSFLAQAFDIGRPALALLGAKGTGKSASLRYAVERRRGGGRLGQVDGLAATPAGFLRDVLAAYGFGEIEAAHADLRNLLSVFIVQARQNGQHVLLQLRDPNMPTPEVADEILWLLTTAASEGGFQLVFSGGEAVERLFESPRLSALAGRCRDRHRLEPLGERETVDYLHFRLGTAGAAEPPAIVPDEAARAIHAVSGGVVAVVNRVAAAALTAAGRAAASRVDRAAVRRAAEALGLAGGAADGWRLDVRLEQLPYLSLPLGEGKLLIGRHAHNEVNLRDASVSRYHAMIVPESEGWAIVDLNSTNGTRVNGERVQHRVLAVGDRIEVGRFEIELAGTSPCDRAGHEPPDMRRTVVLGER